MTIYTMEDTINPLHVPKIFEEFVMLYIASRLFDSTLEDVGSALKLTNVPKFCILNLHGIKFDMNFINPLSSNTTPENKICGRSIIGAIAIALSGFGERLETANPRHAALIVVRQALIKNAKNDCMPKTLSGRSVKNLTIRISTKA